MNPPFCSRTPPPSQRWLPCPFCGRQPEIISRGYFHAGAWVDWVSLTCNATQGGCGCSQSAATEADVTEKWNTRATSGDEQKILHAAQTNRIWLNAMTFVRPTDDDLIELGLGIVEMLREPANLVTLDQDSPCEATRRLGQLTPVLFLRINQS